MGRIFTVVGRDKTVMVCDSKTGKGSYREYESTLIGSLYSVRDILRNISNTPAYSREDRYVILIPDSITGLRNAGTVNYWMQHRKSLRGTALSMEFVGLVSDIVSYINEIGNVKLLTGSKMYAGIYATQYRRAWATLNTVKPKVEKKSVYMAR